MAVKPGYKQTEVGVIPEDWEVKPTNQIGTSVRGGSPRPAGDPRYFNGSYIPWLTVAAITNISASQIEVTSTASFLTEEGSKFSRTLHPGTLIIANSGATLGVAKILKVKCCANDGIAAILDLNKCASAHYLAHYINTKTDYLRNIVATGNGQPNLNTELIGNFKIPLPPTKTEQEAIAEALSDADALIDSLEQLLAKKRDIKQGAMQELLTEKRRLPGFSGEWAEKPLGDLYSFSGGHTASRAELSEQGYCYLHYGDIHTSNKSFIDIDSEFHNFPKLNIELKEASASSLLTDGDMVFVDASEDEEGTSKHIAIVNPRNTPLISGLHTIVAKRKTDEIDFLYQRHCFQTHEVKAQFRFFSVGTKVSGISKSNLAKINLKFPSTREQTAIAAILSEMDEEIVALETKLAKARQIKQGMMQELLTGRIRLV